MKLAQQRAFKEWAVACEAMAAGEQTILIRKGGIREENGVFRINEPEFFLLPTYEHQNARLLTPHYAEYLAEIQKREHDYRTVKIRSYAVVDTILTARDEEEIRGLAREHIWNEEYVRMRFDYHPYDPLYVLLMRVYNLREAVTIPMRQEYAGCRSWVTLDMPIETAGALPAIKDDEFSRRRETIYKTLNPARLLAVPGGASR